MAIINPEKKCTLIYELETYAAVMSLVRLGRMWRDSDVILFLGDEASLATHQWEIRFEFCQKLFNTLFEWECESRCNVWFERVPSASNPADDPSRLTFRCNPDFVQGLTPGATLCFTPLASPREGASPTCSTLRPPMLK